MQFDILDAKGIRLTEDTTYENTDCMFHTQNFPKRQTVIEE